MKIAKMPSTRVIVVCVLIISILLFIFSPISFVRALLMKHRVQNLVTAALDSAIKELHLRKTAHLLAEDLIRQTTPDMFTLINTNPSSRTFTYDGTEQPSSCIYYYRATHIKPDVLYYFHDNLKNLQGEPTPLDESINGFKAIRDQHSKCDYMKVTYVFGDEWELHVYAFIDPDSEIVSSLEYQIERIDRDPRKLGTHSVVRDRTTAKDEE